VRARSSPQLLRIKVNATLAGGGCREVLAKSEIPPPRDAAVLSHRDAMPLPPFENDKAGFASRERCCLKATAGGAHSIRRQSCRVDG
jgi:hypothetical protein